MIRLSGADYTWPSLPHTAALDLIAALGCEGVDLGYMTQRSHIRPEHTVGQIERVAGAIRERLDARDLAVADVFAIPFTDFQTMSANNPDPAEQASSLEFFAGAAQFSAAVGAPGLTTLPGVLFPGDTFGSALRRSADGLGRRLEVATAHGLALSVEPHTASLIDTPEKTLELLDLVPGLTITLDYAHYVFGGVEQRDIDPLLTRARHLQCRPGRPGALQVRVAQDAIDWTTVVSGLVEQGYPGYLALEYTWQDWLDCNQVDTVGESSLLRDVLLAAQRRVDPVNARA